MRELKPNRTERFTIPLVPVTTKNSQKICKNPRTGAQWIGPSDKFREYEHSCAWFMPHFATIREPVEVRGLFYMPTHRRVDLVNLEEALLDVLVKYAILDDDNSEIVVSMDGSRVLYDKENPRTEVTITYLNTKEGKEHR